MNTLSISPLNDGRARVELTQDLASGLVVTVVAHFPNDQTNIPMFELQAAVLDAVAAAASTRAHWFRQQAQTANLPG